MARKQTVKLVRKKWYDIVTSGHFDGVKVGETYLDDPNRMIGKPIAVNVMNLTGNFKQNQITIDYEVTKLEGDKGVAQFRAYRLSPSFLKRIVRRRSTRIDHSFIAKTADGMVRLKPMVIARNHVSTDLKNEIRKAATIALIKKASGMRTEELLASLLSITIQRDLKKELSTFAPIKLVEVRVMEKVESGEPLTVESVQTRGFSTKKIRKTVRRTARGEGKRAASDDVDAEEDLDALAVEEDEDETSEDFDDSEVVDIEDDAEEEPKKAAKDSKEDSDDDSEEDVDEDSDDLEDADDSEDAEEEPEAEESEDDAEEEPKKAAEESDDGSEDADEEASEDDEDSDSKESEKKSKK